MRTSNNDWDPWAIKMAQTMEGKIPCNLGLLDGTVVRFQRAKDSGDFLELDPTARIIHPQSLAGGGRNESGMLVRKDAIIWIDETGEPI